MSVIMSYLEIQAILNASSSKKKWLIILLLMELS